MWRWSACRRRRSITCRLPTGRALLCAADRCCAAVQRGQACAAIWRYGGFRCRGSPAVPPPICAVSLAVCTDARCVAAMLLLRPLSASGSTGSARRLSAVGWALLAPRTTLRVTWGAQPTGLPRPADRLSEQPLIVSPAVEPHRAALAGGRAVCAVAVRAGDGLAAERRRDRGSAGVPGDGQPILLGVEQAATGGYPKLAQLISADLPLVGRLRPGQTLSLSPVSLAEARAAYRSQNGR